MGIESALIGRGQWSGLVPNACSVPAAERCVRRAHRARRSRRSAHGGVERGERPREGARRVGGYGGSLRPCLEFTGGDFDAVSETAGGMPHVSPMATSAFS